MNTRPVIGHTTWNHVVSTALGQKTPIQATASHYIDQIERAGGTPVLLPGADPTVLDILDGLVICGGGDIDPSLYGQTNAGLSERIDADADERDIRFAKQAREIGLPTLGVCRGLQVINVAAGGSLNQHLLGTDEHPELSESIEMNNELRQRISVVRGSALEQFYGEATDVNSLHHQGIQRLGSDLRVVATASDGVIEAVEGTDDWPVLGVQWHPEILGEHGSALFRDLIDKARRYRMSRRPRSD
ncbi:MAG: gamma-glutamyl-gamma-aminobutyrate hydrolase family protein [Acidimicrobiia bacterium]|nr:gamma-glutamyl-gamma-aminobutyrate hydrolase family protein [Acidimicrobiia bacterium]